MDKVDSLYKAIEIVQNSSYPSEVKSTATVFFASYFVRPLGNTYSIPCAFFLV